MYNLIVLAARPDDWTHEQFIDWWRGEHAEVTYPLPGLRRWLHTELDRGHRREVGRLGRPLDPQLRLARGPRRRPRQPGVGSRRRPRRPHARASDDLHRRRDDHGGRAAGRLMVRLDRRRGTRGRPRGVPDPAAHAQRRPASGQRLCLGDRRRPRPGRRRLADSRPASTSSPRRWPASGTTWPSIHDVYVTHVHRDHYTLAIELRRRFGTRVHLGRDEAPGLQQLLEIAQQRAGLLVAAAAHAPASRSWPP